MKIVRCAIYTRKSSEEGLEQDFNSLDAQHAASAAYIASQASEGWSLVGQRYDDGGISGGTLDRPALQRLLADIAARRIDIVVVYKVDRLTRSLLDFAKLVETFDKAGTSFVSVTQSFNTTTSMGRLTLNMLLSFAQFEREVTAERIRDKLAASKARGMWMGGTPPLGYRPDGRSLAIVERDAELVRALFGLYLELGNVRLLQEELDRRGIVKPRRTTKAGRSFGGTPFNRGELYSILANPIYIGRIRYKAMVYDGLHPRIIDDEMWKAVQARLADNRNGDRHVRAAAEHPSILAGKIFDEAGQKMIPSHANKGSRRYRYYVSQDLQLGGDATEAKGMRIPAQEVERLICGKLAELLADPVALVGNASAGSLSSDAMADLIAKARILASSLDGKDESAAARTVASVVERVEVGPTQIVLTVDRQAIAKRLGIKASDHPEPLQIVIPVRLKRSGLAMRLVLPTGQTAVHRINDNLVEAIAMAHRWWQQMIDDPRLRISDLAKANGVTNSWVTRILRLAFLDPTMVDQILAGKAPANITAQALRSEGSIPALWAEQRARHLIGSTI
jgi:DNA invertase Pin-like site-specific DNA recombinase